MSVSEGRADEKAKAKGANLLFMRRNENKHNNQVNQTLCRGAAFEVLLSSRKIQQKRSFRGAGYF